VSGHAEEPFDQQAEAAGSPRHRGREVALQVLYQWEVGRTDIGEAVERYWWLEGVASGASDTVRQFASALARGTVEHLAEIDPLIEARLEHWRLVRMAVIDRLILRLAVYELVHAKDVPPAVVIDEALELARTYSSEDAVKFVNGVLDAVRRNLNSKEG
jgi:N utilization substance protein B